MKIIQMNNLDFFIRSLSGIRAIGGKFEIYQEAASAEHDRFI